MRKCPTETGVFGPKHSKLVTKQGLNMRKLSTTIELSIRAEPKLKHLHYMPEKKINSEKRDIHEKLIQSDLQRTGGMRRDDRSRSFKRQFINKYETYFFRQCEGAAVFFIVSEGRLC